MSVYLCNNNCMRIDSTMRIVNSYSDRKTGIESHIVCIWSKILINPAYNRSIIIYIQFLCYLFRCHTGLLQIIPIVRIVWMLVPVQTVPTKCKIFLLYLSSSECFILGFHLLFNTVILVSLALWGRIKYTTWRSTRSSRIDLRGIGH